MHRIEGRIKRWSTALGIAITAGVALLGLFRSIEATGAILVLAGVFTQALLSADNFTPGTASDTDAGPSGLSSYDKAVLRNHIQREMNPTRDIIALVATGAVVVGSGVILYVALAR